ncbi:MAG: hypothetical protein ABH828_02310 [archaeon]
MRKNDDLPNNETYLYLIKHKEIWSVSEHLKAINNGLKSVVSCYTNVIFDNALIELIGGLTGHKIAGFEEKYTKKGSTSIYSASDSTNSDSNSKIYHGVIDKGYFDLEKRIPIVNINLFSNETFNKRIFYENLASLNAKMIHEVKHSDDKPKHLKTMTIDDQLNSNPSEIHDRFFYVMSPSEPGKIIVSCD